MHLQIELMIVWHASRWELLFWNTILPAVFILKFLRHVLLLEGILFHNPLAHTHALRWLPLLSLRSCIGFGIINLTLVLFDVGVEFVELRLQLFHQLLVSVALSDIRTRSSSCWCRVLPERRCLFFSLLWRVVPLIIVVRFLPSLLQILKIYVTGGNF